MGFLQMLFIKKTPSIAKCFYSEKVLDFVKRFFSTEMNMWFCPLFH